MNGFKKGAVAAIAALVIAAADAHAADVTAQGTRGFEFGLGAGEASLTEDLFGLGSNTDNKFGFNVFGGYRFARYFSLEAGYLDGGSYKWSTVDGPNVARLSAQLRAAQISAVGTLPIGDYFGLFGRIGADHWWASADATDGGLSGRDSGSTTSFMWGAGAAAFWDGAQIRLEYQQSNDDDVFGSGLPGLNLRHRYISASIVWLF
jgi:opacity protein-like surface antigen